MTAWQWGIFGGCVVAWMACLGAIWMGRTLLGRRRNRHDPAWQATGIRMDQTPYDEQKAARGFYRSLTHTPAGRVYPAKPKVPGSRVTEFPTRRRP